MKNARVKTSQTQWYRSIQRNQKHDKRHKCRQVNKWRTYRVDLHHRQALHQLVGDRYAPQRRLEVGLRLHRPTGRRSAQRLWRRRSGAGRHGLVLVLGLLAVALLGWLCVADGYGSSLARKQVAQPAYVGGRTTNERCRGNRATCVCNM